MKSFLRRNPRQRSRPPSYSYERQLLTNHRTIAGVDEVGRGAWAGSLVAAAVILKPDRRIYRVRDSKLLSAKQRRKIAVTIKRRCRSWGIGIVEVKELNKIGLARAVKLAQLRAVRKLRIRPDYLLVDGNGKHLVDRIKTEHIVKADLKILSVAAASVIAKVYRDKLMAQLAKQYPAYQFDKNKGYGTKFHHRVIQRRGICPEHRLQYLPIKRLLKRLLIKRVLNF